MITVLKAAPTGGDGTYSIVVEGWQGAATSVYKLVATSDKGTTELATGNPQRGTVGKDLYNYYKYTLPAAQSQKELTFTVTSLAGDPDMVVSASNQHPRKDTAGSYEWMATSDGGDAVSIMPSTHGAGDTTFYVGVTAYGAPATFLITASLDDPVTLLDGQPLDASAIAGQTRLYKLLVGGGGARPHDIKVTATPLAGNVDLFITSCPDSSPPAACVTPDAYHFTWEVRARAGAGRAGAGRGGRGADAP